MKVWQRVTVVFLLPLFLISASLSAHAASPSEKVDSALGQVIDESSNYNDDLKQILEEARLVRADGQIQETNGIYWKKVSTLDKGSSPITQPMFSVGIGWYLYIYLTPRDWNFLASVGWGAASAGVCTLAGGGVIGGISCGAVGSAIGWYLADKTGPKGNQCAEVKVRAGTSPVGYKVINKSCAALGK